MAGNWMDDRDRMNREREGRGQGEGARYGRDEDRSWDRAYGRPDMYSAERSGPGRDRVFGERENGGDYTGRAGPAGGYQGRGQGAGAPRFRTQDYTRNERSQGGDDRTLEFGWGAHNSHDNQRRPDDPSYSASRAAYHGNGFGNPGFDDYGHDAQGRPLSGGTGGYDYERGYGDGGRREQRTERIEDAGRKSGEFLHRAGQKVASWFATAGENTGFDHQGRDAYGDDRGHRGRGPKTYKRSDGRIEEDANERLTEDRWLDASDINVAVSGGEVTLSGTVDSREAKHRAERIVEDISGVNHVQNNLRVSQSAGDRTGDLTRLDNDALAGGPGGGPVVGGGPIGSSSRKT